MATINAPNVEQLDLEKLEAMDARSLIQFAFDAFGDRAAIGTSLQKTGIVMIDIASRLGLDDGPVAELPARMELTRILNRGPYRDGSLEIRKTTNGTVLHYRFEEYPIVTEIAANQVGWDEMLGTVFAEHALEQTEDAQ